MQKWVARCAPRNARSVGDPSLDWCREDGRGHTATGPILSNVIVITEKDASFTQKEFAFYLE
jgi:hypothetical protein